MKKCVRRLLVWKEGMEKKGLRVNMGKTKKMMGGTNLNILQSSGRFLCGVCHTGVGRNSVKCNKCKQWVHKKCSGLKRVKEDLQTQVGSDKLEVVASFCYLGDMLSAAGGCELSTTSV